MSSNIVHRLTVHEHAVKVVDGKEASQRLKDAAVQRVITASWPQLMGSDGAEQMAALSTELNVPEVWLAQARAWWAASVGDGPEEVAALVAIQQYAIAEAKLMNSVAPTALRAQRVPELSALVGLWIGVPLSPGICLLQVRLQ